MAGTGGKEVGKVTIRVVPDLDSFRERLKAELERYERNPQTIKFKADFDDAGLRRKAKALVESIPDGVIDVDTNFRKSALKEITDSLDRVKDSADRALFGDAAKGLAARINTDIDPASRAKWKAEIQQELAALRGLAFDLQPRLDSTFAEKVKARLAGEDITVDVEPETKGATAKLIAWAAAMRASLRIKVPVVLDKFSAVAATARKGATLLQKGFDGLNRAVRKFDAESIVQAVAIVAAVVALAAPAIALLSGALLALPAAITAAVVPMGVIALGIDGITKAAETAKPAFEELKASVSEVFASPDIGMVKGFEQIRDRLIPGIKVPLQGVAEALSTSFNDVIGALSSGSGLNNLQRIIDNISAGINTATPGLVAFTNGFNSLVAKLSGGFPGVGEAFSRLGADFEAWIAKISANGQLDTAMTNLKDTLGEIGGTIKDIAQWGFDNLADPAFGAKMKEFAADLRAIVNELLPLLKSGFEDVADIIGGIADSIKVVKDAANSFEKFTRRSADATNPDRIADQKKKWGTLADFGITDDANVVKWFKALTGQAERSGNEAGTAVADGLNSNLASGLEKTKQQLETALKVEAPQSIEVGGGINAGGIGPAIEGKVDTAIGAARAKLTAFQSEFAGQIAQTLVPLQEIPTKLNGVFANLGASFVGAFSALQGIVTPLVDGVANAIVTAFNTIPTKLMGSFAMLGAAVGGAMAGLRGVIASSLGGITDAFGQAFAGAAGRVASALSAVPGAVGAALSPTIGVVQQVMLGVINVIATTGQQVIALATTAFSQFAPVVQAAMAPAITAVSTICQQMVDTAMSYASVMENAGRAIGSSFAAGLASSEGLVSSAAAALMQAARNMIPSSPAKEGPFSGSGWVDNSGKSVGEAFAQGMQGTVGEVVGVAKVLMQQVRDVFGNAEGVVFNFNFNGMSNGLDRTATSLGAVQTQFGSINTQAQELQTNLGAAALPPGLVGPEAKAQSAQLKQQLEELEIARKTLELQKVPGGDNTAIKAQLEQIRLRKLELGLQKNQLDYANKYGSAQNGITDAYGQQIQDLAGMPMDFGKAVSGQFMSDLGFGNGAIPTIANQLMDWGSQIVFNVSNMDDALQGQKRFQNQQSAAMIGR